MDNLRSQLEIAERDADLATASRIKYGDLPELEKKLASAREELAAIPTHDRLLREEVTPDDIAGVVARWTGIPVERLMESESSKLTKIGRIDQPPSHRTRSRRSSCSKRHP